MAVILWTGVALRVVQLLARRSLWIDETFVGLAVGSNGPLELLTSSHRFLFLLAEWAATRLGGMNELALRALPFAAGIALLVSFSRLASRLLELRVVWFAVALAALSPALIYYANEAKAYGIDALVTVLLLGCGLDVLEAEDSRRAWRRLLPAGALALLVSIPAAFVLAGIGIALATAPQVRPRPEGIRRLALTVALWAAVLAALYVTLYRPTATNPDMRSYWDAGFLTPQSPELLRRAWQAAGSVIGAYFVGGRPEPAAVVFLWGLVVAGLLAIARQWGRSTALLLAGPLVAAVAASALQRYPVAPRTMLFALPIAAVSLAAGAAMLVDWLPAPRRAPALGLLGIVCLIPAGHRALRGTLRPPRPEDARPVVAEFSSRHRPGEPIYVLGRAVAAWLFYTTDWAAPDTARIRRVNQLVSGAAYENSPSRGRSVHHEGQELADLYHGRCELLGVPTGMQRRLATRVPRDTPDPGWADNEASRIQAAAQPYIWLFFSHFLNAERTALLDAVNRAGGRVEFRFEGDGAAVYQYRFDAALARAVPVPRCSTNSSTGRSGTLESSVSPRE